MKVQLAGGHRGHLVSSVRVLISAGCQVWVLFWENTAVLGSWTKEPGFADLWADGFAVYGNVMLG